MKILTVEILSTLILLQVYQLAYGEESLNKSLKSDSVKMDKIAEDFEKASINADSCKRAIKRFLPYIEKLRNFLPERSGIHPEYESAVLKIELSWCDSSRRTQAIRILRKSLTRSSSKIGLILPQLAEDDPIGMNTKQGIKHALGKYFDEKYIKVIHTGISRDSLNKAIANLYFHHNISLIVGGANKAQSTAINYWSKALHLPAILLNSETPDSLKNPHSINVFPSPQVLGKALADIAARKNYKSIAVLSPNGTTPEPLVTSFLTRAKSRNINILGVYHYTPFDFTSVDNAVLSVIKPISKSDSNSVITTEQGLHTGSPQSVNSASFGSKSSMTNDLEDQIEYTLLVDAVMINDDFRMLHHFAKMFSYYGIHQVPLLGSHQWRSTGLVKNYQPILEGAVFADFIGRYTDLPAKILDSPPDNELFVEPESISKIDFRLVGFRAGKLALQALKSESKDRYKISKQLLNIKIADSYNHSSDLRKNFSVWPSFLFEVKDKQVRMLPTKKNLR